MGRHLADRLAEGLGGAEPRMHDRALDNLRRVVERQERTWRDHGSRIDVAVLRRLEADRGLGLHRYSVGRYSAQVVEACQRELVAGYLQGLSVSQIADRVAGTDGVFARHRGRAALIVRMELARIYDAGAQASLEEAAALDEPGTSDPLLKQAQEYLDARNHPFSRRLHRVAVYPRQEWEIRVSGEAARGLVWRVTAGVAHGRSYPAHYHDRGRQVPWRPSWGDGIWLRQSLLTPDVRRADLRGLRAIIAGREPRALSEVGRRHLEIAGYLDHNGRPTDLGRQAAQIPE